jgi:hypothetical protein
MGCPLSGSFLKKRTKKLLFIGVYLAGSARHGKKFFGSFFSKKNAFFLQPVSRRDRPIATIRAKKTRLRVGATGLFKSIVWLAGHPARGLLVSGA